MGQKTILNTKQRLILNEFKSDFRLASFYFTGGSALSEYYLKHRESVDLDFFSREKFDPQAIYEAVNEWSNKFKFKIEVEYVDPVHHFTLNFDDGDKLKVDFARYPYRNLEDFEIFDELRVNSFFDISVNKMMVITQRVQAKDFVDLYFIFQKYNFWQLRDGAAAKFNLDLEPFAAAGDFMRVEQIEDLPKMYKKLDLKTLKNYFVSQAQKLGKEAI